MLKSETQDIEGLSVTVSQLPGRASLRANFRFMKMIMAGGFGGSGSIEQMIASAVKGADIDDLMSLSMELLSTARVVCDGKIYEMSDEKNIDAVFPEKHGADSRCHVCGESELG